MKACFQPDQLKWRRSLACELLTVSRATRFVLLPESCFVFVALRLRVEAREGVGEGGGVDADEETVEAASLTSSTGSGFAARFGVDLLVTPPALVLRSGDFFAAKRRRATGAGFLAAPVVLLRGRGGAVREKGVGAKRELTGGVDGDASDAVVSASPSVLKSRSSSARIPAPSRARTSFSYS